MCNRYRPTRRDRIDRAEELLQAGIRVRWQNIGDDGEYVADGDVWPTYPAPILRLTDDGWIGELRTWGLIPPGWKPPSDDILRDAKQQQRKSVNARSETLDVKWPWKLVYKSQRCVLPADYFFEPHRDGGQARYFATDERVLFIPGLWHTWKDQSTTVSLATFTMLTTSAGLTVGDTRGGQRRDRQPVVLQSARDIVEYCDLETVELSHLKTLLEQTGDSYLTHEHEPRPSAQDRRLF